MAVEEKTIAQLTVGTGKPRKDTLVPFWENGETFRTKISELTAGLSVDYINTVDDFPAPVGGIMTLEDKGYVILNPIVVPDNIRFPTAWNGFIRSTNQIANKIIFTGGGPLFSTKLDANAIIDSIADAGSGAITITTLNPHSINDGDLINIVPDTVPTYAQQKLVVSNRTTTTFDVQIPFVSTDTGTIDAGVVSAIFDDLFCAHATPGTSDDLFAVQATPDPLSVFLAERVIGVNFRIPFVISHFQTAVTNFCSATFRSRGILLDDCIDSSVNTCKFTADATSLEFAKAVELFGDDIRDVVLFNSKLNLALGSQHAILVDPLITQADINITSCPDNKVNLEYFDPAGLDQTDRQIITLNNGIRQDSEDLAEVVSDVILQTAASTGSFTRIENDVPASGDYILESTSEGFTMDDTSTGVITYKGRKPKRVRIEYSVEAQKTSGGSQNIQVRLQVAGVPQSRTLRVMSVSNVFTTLQYLGGFFMISPDETIEIHKNNDTPLDGPEFQNIVILIR